MDSYSSEDVLPRDGGNSVFRVFSLLFPEISDALETREGPGGDCPRRRCYRAERDGGGTPACRRGLHKPREPQHLLFQRLELRLEGKSISRDLDSRQASWGPAPNV